MNRSLLIAATSVLAVAGSAQATTYYFVEDGCSGTGGCGASPSTPVGTVVTSLVSPGVINVDVTLTSGAFHDTNDPEHHALAFDLASTPTITVSDLGTPFTADGVETPGSVSASPFGSFEYVINFPHVTHPPVVTSFSFDISAPGLALSSFVSNTHAYFTSDIWAGPGQTGNTGNVGALLGSSVPEPAAWAFMLVGLGGLGALMRSQRRAVAQA